MDVTCEDCKGVVVGKVRRGRCENCYRRHLGALKAGGAFIPVPRAEYAPRRGGTLAAPTVRDPKVPMLFAKVTPGWGGCWIYTGPINDQGYGQAHIGRNKTGAHRLAYQLAHGSIPDAMQVDHTCHTEDANCPGGVTCVHRRCINRSHLEAVTARENTLRSKGLPALNAIKTHCIHGHEFTPENTVWRRRSGAPHRLWRQCQTCVREYRSVYQPAWRAARKSA